VNLMAAASTDPQLEVCDVDMLLSRYEGDDGTFDDDSLMRATADAWDLKTSRVTDHYDASVNGRGLSAQQVKQNCEERARWFRRRIGVQVA
jgi:hypothetical protein